MDIKYWLWKKKKDKRLEDMCDLAYIKDYEGKRGEKSDYVVYGCRISEKGCNHGKHYQTCDKYQTYKRIHKK